RPCPPLVGARLGAFASAGRPSAPRGVRRPRPASLRAGGFRRRPATPAALLRALLHLLLDLAELLVLPHLEHLLQGVRRAGPLGNDARGDEDEEMVLVDLVIPLFE